MTNEFNLSGANLELWLKADAGVQEAAGDAAENGDNVQFWRDQSGNGVDVSQNDTDRRPNLISNSINFNPTVSFNGGTNGDVLTATLSSFSGNQPYSIFAVFNPSNILEENLFAIGEPRTQRNIAYHPNFGGRRYLYHLNDDLIVPGTLSGWQLASFLHSSAASGVDRFYYDNGKEVHSVDGSLNLPTDPLLSVGGYDNRGEIYGEEFTGDIAEFIVFDNALGNAERNQVESYLAIKYGSTLDQATPTNYTASNGTVVWNATANSNYKNDIAGIGQDDDTSLNQTQSRSINTDSIVTIGNASNLENGEFLVWGNDNGSTTEVNTNIPTNVEIENRLGRVWQTQETGDVGTVDVSFDLSGLSVTGTQTSDFRLLVDADGDFVTGATVVAANSFANSTVTFTGVDFSDGDYYTLVTNINDAPTVEAGIGNQTTAEDATFTFTIPQNAFADVDGDTLTYTATLADGSDLPAWLTFDGQTFSGTPLISNVGTIEVKVTASDASESVQTNFNLEVTNTDNSTVVKVNGTEIDNSEIESYGGSQDNPNQGTVAILPDNQINLTGNRWQKVEINSTITANTVLRFEFASNGEGEIQGVGFDNDNVIRSSDARRLFQVGGSQNWGIQNLGGFVVGQVDDKDIYEIQVGQFFTGDFRYLTIANDHDVDNSNSEAQLSNIELFEGTPDLLNISINEVTETKEVESYGGDSQNSNLTTAIANHGSQLNLEGNGWKRLDITGYVLDENTQLNFEFKSNGEGEIQGIGFDNDNNISSRDDAQHFFQLTGSQSFGIEDSQYINSLGTSEDGFTSYSIDVGQLFTGEFNYLTFGNDHDVNNSTTVGEFRNISLG